MVSEVSLGNNIKSVISDLCESASQECVWGLGGCGFLSINYWISSFIALILECLNWTVVEINFLDCDYTMLNNQLGKNNTIMLLKLAS